VTQIVTIPSGTGAVRVSVWLSYPISTEVVAVTCSSFGSCKGKTYPEEREKCQLFKQTFNIGFVLGGRLVLLPVIGIIAAAIKLEDGGPILYQQDWTAVFGETFSIFKFRPMTPAGESATPIVDDNNDRIIRVGRFLRQTHSDEIPQLWSILRGDMSVVGPRVVWTEEEHLLEAETDTWRKRWFVKPG